MTNPIQVSLPGSNRTALIDAELVGPPGADETLDFTVILRRRAELPSELVVGADTVSTAELQQRYGADPIEMAQVSARLVAEGVRIVEQHAGSRRIRANAPVEVAQRLFGTELNTVRQSHPVSGETVELRTRSGELQLPAEFDGVVVAVLGLDNRPQARPFVLTSADPSVVYTPPQLGEIYGFPADADGTGQIGALIELGGGITTADLDAYFQGLGITLPSVTPVSVDGAQNVSDPNYDGEVMLDIEVFGALAPKAKQLVYFAPNSDQGFVDAISQAVHATPTPTVVSISWGGTEDDWTAQARNAMDAALADGAALGVTVCAASGDHGSSNGESDGQAHVNYPASSPYTLGVGGTTLHADPNTGALQSETVWNDNNGNAGGGGVSDVYPLPSWQAEVGVPTRAGASTTGRGVPDVAADADPYTGYQVRVGGQSGVYGGTSAATPLWAALLCRYAQLLGTSFGLAQTALYRSATKGNAAPGLRPISTGNNGAYTAGPGWNACAGLGVPNGSALEPVLRPHK